MLDLDFENGLAPEVRAVLTSKLLTDFEFFNRFFFMHIYGRKFLMGAHHHLIAEKMKAVARGDIRRLIINVPPRYSKCIDPETSVLTSEGMKRAGNVKFGDVLFSFDNGRLVQRRCLGTEPAFKKSVKVELRSGRTIVCSMDHRLLSTFGYVEAGKLQAGDRLVALRANYEGNHRIPEAELEFITMMIFDGTCRDGRWTKKDETVIKTMEDACGRLGFTFKKISGKYQFYVGQKDGNVRCMLEKYGIYGKHSYDKRLPSDWFTLDRDLRLRFIDLMFATDGFINTTNGQGGVALANRGLVEDVQTMLSSVGIVSTMTYRPNKCRGAWGLSIPRGEMVKLLGMIPFTAKRKSAESCLRKWSATTIDSYPYRIITHEHLSGKTLKMGLRCDCSKQISSKKFKCLVENFPQLKKYILDDFYYDTVVGIHDVGDRELIHLSVEGTHNFIANGIVSHNSEMAVRSFISWGLANNPRARFMHLSASDDLVNDNSDAIRDIIKSPAFRYLFPETVISRKTDAKDKWYTTQNGGLYAVSTGGQITGFGAGDFGDRQYRGTGSDADGFGGAIIIDDPLKPADALSDLKRERINARYNNTIASRVNNPGVTPVVLIMQRIHDHDMAGFLLGGGSGEPWESLVLPAINDDGTPLWPEKHSIEQLERMKAADPETFAAQYMQSPMVATGNIFRREWFRFWDKTSLPVIFDKVFQSWDFTFKNAAHSDNVCGTLWGKKGPNFYLLDCDCRKMGFVDSVRAMLAMSERHPEAIAKYVEAKANGEAIMDMLSERVSGIIPVNPKESKLARAHAVSPLFQAGNVYLPDPSIAPWVYDFIDELTKFPNAAHDDRVDSTTQALSQNMQQTTLWDML